MVLVFRHGQLRFWFHLLNYGQTVAIMQAPTSDSAITLPDMRCLQRAQLPEKLKGAGPTECPVSTGCGSPQRARWLLISLSPALHELRQANDRAPPSFPVAGTANGDFGVAAAARRALRLPISVFHPPQDCQGGRVCFPDLSR